MASLPFLLLDEALDAVATSTSKALVATSIEAFWDKRVPCLHIFDASMQDIQGY